MLRFNFRGTGLSHGTHDGRAEAGDVLAAMDWLENAYKRPLVVAGFSFGSAMALMACCKEAQKPERVRGVAALGLPTEADGHHYRYPFLASSPIPKLFLSGDNDLFAPGHNWRRWLPLPLNRKRLVLIPGADHFFTGQLERMQQALASWLKEQLR